MEDSMKFCWVTINVKEMESSMNFYKEIVGLTVDRIMNPNANMKIVFLGSGETKVELIFDSITENRNYGKDITLGFEVESLEEKIKFLVSKNLKIEGPFQPNPTVKFLYVKDPNGVNIQFVENIKK
jgi:lactoylglutathione lyase